MREDETAAAPAAEPPLPAEKHGERGLAGFVPEKVRKPGEMVFAFLIMMTGVLGWYFALDMSGGSYSSPSVFPKIASSVIAVCGLVILVQSARRRPAGGGPGNAFAYLLPRDVLAMLLMLLVYCLVLPVIHFIPASYLFMAAGMLYLNRGKRIALCLTCPAAVLAVLALVFRYLFLVILP